ncbi:hypothetical protein, partial [Bartonella sp. AA126HLJHH]|uniref:hypothetical protein n=1 Tax=Bartonella sp. AA126HLJHH TaxID=3243426 RepID=UPI0035D087A1
MEWAEWISKLLFHRSNKETGLLCPFFLCFSCFSTGEFGDLIALGIVDPVKVVRSALQNAASIA